MRNSTKKIEKLRQQLFSTARTIFTKQAATPEEVWQLKGYLSWLEWFGQRILPKEARDVLDAYYSQIINYPIAPERASWNLEVLRQQDLKLHEITAAFQSQVLEICDSILKSQKI